MREGDVENGWEGRVADLEKNTLETGNNVASIWNALFYPELFIVPKVVTCEGCD
jgi:hypothetical protein